MASRITTAVAGCALACLVASAAAASPVAASDAAVSGDAASTSRAEGGRPGATELWTTVAHYRMNDLVGPVMTDSSPQHLDGTIGADVRLSGEYYRFPRVRPRTYRPGHPSYVPASPLLNPGDVSFRVSWRFRVTVDAQPVFAPNFLQKGQGWPGGGMFKFTNHDGRVGCLFRDASQQAAVSTPESFNDGQWHVATCARVVGPDPQVTVSVDGEVLGVNHKHVGPIANTWPLAIGGNTRCSPGQGDHPQHCNYWQGDLDWIRVQVQPESSSVTGRYPAVSGP
jgi:hypothetical protein